LPRAVPLGLPRTLSRAPLRRRAPFAWLARALARGHSRGLCPSDSPTRSRVQLRRRAPFAWLARALARGHSHAGCPLGLAAHALARRCAGALRSRGSLARSLAGTPARCAPR